MKNIYDLIGDVNLLSVVRRREIISMLENSLGCQFNESQILRMMNAINEHFVDIVAYEYRVSMFESPWVSPLSDTEHREIESTIVDEIRRRDNYGPILDIGCLHNYFKKYFGAELTGIDPVDAGCDIQTTFEDFVKTNNIKFNTVLALGSLHFGSKADVINRINLVADLLAPDGVLYVRYNNGRIPSKFQYLDICTDWKSHDEMLDAFRQRFSTVENIELVSWHRVIFTCSGPK